MLLETKIQKMQNKLNDLLTSKKNLSNKDIIKYSQELDELISEYYEKKPAIKIQ